MKTTFIAPNGIKVEGIVLYTSPIARDSKSFVNRVYDEIVYAQNRLVKLHHTLKPDDDYKAWDTAETIEEARAKRSKLAMSFFSRRVVIVDENENEVE